MENEKLLDELKKRIATLENEILNEGELIALLSRDVANVANLLVELNSDECDSRA